MRIADLRAHPIAALVVIGIVLRLIAWGAYSSLALDEILLSRNLLELPLRSLLIEPLRLDQVAPRGFVFVEWLAIRTFGTSERALRLFPLLAGVAGMLLFARLALRAIGGFAATLAVGLFAIAVPFLRYSAQVKQYGIDVTATIMILLIALDLRERDATTRRLLLLGLAAFVIVLFSQASVFVMAGVGLAFAVEWIMTRSPTLRRALLFTIPLWAVAAVAAVAQGNRSMSPSTREFMDDFWAGGFMPTPVSLASGRWLWTQLRSLFDDPYLLRYPFAAIMLLVAVIGIVAVWRQRRPLALLLVGPPAIVLVAAIAHQYPFRSRLMLWVVPILLLALAAGIDALRTSAWRINALAGVAVTLVLLWPPVAAIAKATPPYDLEHHRDVLGYLQQHRRAGDVFYVFPLSRMGVAYYQAQYGLTDSDWIIGDCDRNETRPFVRGVDRFRGTPRFWILTTTSPAFRSARAAVRGYLATVGTKRDSLMFPSLTMGTVSLELYDLNDTARLRAADAETFPVQPMSTNPRPGCRTWPMTRLQ